MYEEFYNLRERPFSILPDPGFLYLGRRHTLAYTMLEYGVEHRAGFTVITGGVGCGKTTLIRHLLNHLGEDVRVGLISNTHTRLGELLKWVLLAFDQPYEATDKVALFDRLQRFLIDEYRQSRRCVLIIDEAQNVSGDTLEELRMLSNINADKDLLLQMVLVGQPQLRALLKRPELEQFAQRIAADYHLTELDRRETVAYIVSRLKTAGADRLLFEPRAIGLVYRYARGIPRLINIICDTALVYGFAEEADIVTARIVAQVVRDKARTGLLRLDFANEEPARPVNPRSSKPLDHTLVEFDADQARQLFHKLSSD